MSWSLKVKGQCHGLISGHAVIVIPPVVVIQRVLVAAIGRIHNHVEPVNEGNICTPISFVI